MELDKNNGLMTLSIMENFRVVLKMELVYSNGVMDLII